MSYFQNLGEKNSTAVIEKKKPLYIEIIISVNNAVCFCTKSKFKLKPQFIHFIYIKFQQIQQLCNKRPKIKCALVSDWLNSDCVCIAVFSAGQRGFCSDTPTGPCSAPWAPRRIIINPHFLFFFSFFFFLSFIASAISSFTLSGPCVKTQGVCVCFSFIC